MSFGISLNQSWFVMGVQTRKPSNRPVGDLNANIEVTAFPDWYKRISLEWKIPKEWGDCSFHVYFSHSGEDGYERLTSTPLKTPSFLNPQTQEYSKFRDGFYVVEALLPYRNIRVKSKPASWKYKRRDFLEKRAAEIQRREYILLSKFAGTKSYVFRKRTYGERCDRCWNKETEKVMDDHCPVCYGTSFKGGYFDPVPAFIQFEATPNISTKTYYGELESNQIGAWTISLPEVSSNDVILRAGDWNVYKVIRVMSTELQTNTVRQMMTITQLGRSDIENSLAQRVEDEDAGLYPPTIGGEFGKQRFPTQQLDTNPNNDFKWYQEQNVGNLPEKYKI